MNVKERIYILKVLEKMGDHPKYSKKIGLKNVSKYQFGKIREERKKYDE